MSNDLDAWSRSVVAEGPSEYRFVLESLRRFVRRDEGPAGWPVEIDPLDWSQVLHYADREGVAAIVSHEVERGDLAGHLPDEMSATFKNRRLGAAADYLGQQAVVRELLARLAEGGVSALLLKGSHLAERIYQPPTLRRTGDIDLLVEPADLGDALKILEGEGFVLRGDVPNPLDAGKNDYHSVLDRGAEMVEVHWLLDADEVFNNDLSPLDTRSILERARPDPTLPGALRMHADDEILYLIGHGAKHNWKRLFSLVDIALFVERDDLDWDRIESLSRSYAASWYFESSLILTWSLLGVSPPAELADRLRALWRESPRLRRATAYNQRIWASHIEPWDFDEPFAPWQKERHILATDTRMRRTAGGGIVHAARALTTPRGRDQQLVPLPRGLRWIYRLLRPPRLALVHLRFLAWQRRN